MIRQDPQAVKVCLQQKNLRLNECVKLRYEPPQPALMHACSVEVQPDSLQEMERVQVIRMLICGKADPNATAKDRKQALSVVPTARLASLLINAKARVNDQSNTGNTPLMHAVRDGRVAVVRLLLDRRANTAIQNNERRTAFDLETASKGYHYDESEHAAKIRRVNVQCKQLIRAAEMQSLTDRTKRTQLQVDKFLDTVITRAEVQM